MASKKFSAGSQPGSSVPAGTSPETPEQIIYHSKALHACNPTVGHSSRLVEYEESYACLNFSIFHLFQGYSHLFSLITPFRGLFRGCAFCPRRESGRLRSSFLCSFEWDQNQLDWSSVGSPMPHFSNLGQNFGSRVESSRWQPDFRATKWLAEMFLAKCSLI